MGGYGADRRVATMLHLTAPGRGVHVELILCNSTPCMPRARWQLIVLLVQALLPHSLSLVSWKHHITGSFIANSSCRCANVQQ